MAVFRMSTVSPIQIFSYVSLVRQEPRSVCTYVQLLLLLYAHIYSTPHSVLLSLTVPSIFLAYHNLTYLCRYTMRRYPYTSGRMFNTLRSTEYEYSVQPLRPAYC